MFFKIMFLLGKTESRSNSTEGNQTAFSSIKIGQILDGSTDRY